MGEGKGAYDEGKSGEGLLMMVRLRFVITRAVSMDDCNILIDLVRRGKRVSGGLRMENWTLDRGDTVERSYGRLRFRRALEISKMAACGYVLQGFSGLRWVWALDTDITDSYM